MDPKGFRRCDGFAGSIPQKFVNTSLPVCPLCGTDDPYWTLKDKMELTAHRVMFRCKHCGGVLSATQNDFNGTTKSTAFAALTTEGAMNALIKKNQGKDVKTVYLRVEDVGECRTTDELLGKELPIEEYQAMAAAFGTPIPVVAAEDAPAEAAPEVTPIEPEQIQVTYAEPAPAAPAEPAEPVAPAAPVAPAVPVQPAAPAAPAQPVYQQPVQPVYQQPVQPVYQQPVYQQPVYQQPVYQQPVYQQPMYQQPVYQQPVQPVYQQPVYKAPAAPKPAGPRFPVLSFIFLMVAFTFALIGFAVNMSYGNSPIPTLISFVGYVLMVVGMCLFRMKRPIVFALGVLLLAVIPLLNLIQMVIMYLDYPRYFTRYPERYLTLIYYFVGFALKLIVGICYLAARPRSSKVMKLIAVLSLLVFDFLFMFINTGMYGSVNVLTSSLVSLLFITGPLYISWIFFNPFRKK